MTTHFTIEKGMLGDLTGITALYRAVAAIEGGLARTADEITDEYVEAFVRKSIETGILIVAREGMTGEIIGEIHAYALGPVTFAHVLGELTIAVHPASQGIGAGKALFNELLREVKDERPDILRVELIARESNQKAIEFYRKLGFEIEGRFVDRIASVGGGFEDDIPMAWRRSEEIKAS